MCKLCRTKEVVPQLIAREERRNYAKYEKHLVEQHCEFVMRGLEGLDVAAFLAVRSREHEASREMRIAITRAIYKSFIHQLARDRVPINDKVRFVAGRHAIDLMGFPHAGYGAVLNAAIEEAVS